ncbi:hypothetical protein HMPREF9244_00302 [Alloscardovia omnicolens F0580]|uniref:Uncharacterized protein n=1 Tax=Alloscardovia omnicolens F0580 TaxID=1321816 RepID=U1SIW8_9BIFI|nr:hypothetical protein HMPREF9244_00302 [Alloscardovia omnicolens F0580]
MAVEGGEEIAQSLRCMNCEICNALRGWKEVGVVESLQLNP